VVFLIKMICCLKQLCVNLWLVLIGMKFFSLVKIKSVLNNNEIVTFAIFPLLPLLSLLLLLRINVF